MSGWHILVYAGQSNECEVGLGTYTDTTTIFDSRIFQVGRGGSNDMQIIPAVRPLDYWTPGPGHGSGLSRARLYIQRKYLPAGYNLLIVPAAKGSTSILQWNKVIDGDGSPLWDDMVARIAVGLTLPNATVQMLVWRQMEADITIARTPANPNHGLMPDADAYLAQELALIDNFRALYGPVPIIRGRTTDAWLRGDAVKDSFTAAVNTVPSLRPNYGVTDSTNATSNFNVTGNVTDKIHFSADAQERIATRDILWTWPAVIA